MPSIINAETFIPQLLLDYVETRRTGLSIPVSADLPFYAGIRDGVSCSPCVVFYCEAWEMQHPERMSLAVSVTLINDRAAEESADESEIAAQIRRALADVAALKAWMLTLTEAESTGWDMTKYLITRGGIEIDAELSQRRRSTLLEVHCRTTETAVPQV